jgi:tetratricopeptide (TPR) repeat protein
MRHSGESVAAGSPADSEVDADGLDLESELLEAKQALHVEEGESARTTESTLPPSTKQEISQLTSRLSSVPDDHHSRVRYAQLLVASERMDEARTEFERALSAFEAAGEHREAMHVLEELLHLDPDDMTLFVRRIRVAARLDDEGVLINSYLQLGGCIEKRLSSFTMRLLSSSSDSGDVSTVFDISQKTSTNM